jgi:hypothetical protein
MALATKALPFGMRQIRLTPLGAGGDTPGTAVTLPVARKLTFSEVEDFTELRGDDAPQATHGSGPSVEWDIEAGGISLEAYAVIAGGAVTSAGVTPNIIKTYRKLDSDVRPYFKMEGRAINDNGGDFHVLIYRCKADGSIDGEFADGAFWLTSCSGKGYGSLEATPLGRVYDFLHQETAAAIA